MDAPTSILEATRGLIDDPSAKAEFVEDPEGFLASRGLDAFSGPELAEALTHVADALPAAEAAQLPSPEELDALGEGTDAPAALLGEVAQVEASTSAPVHSDFGDGFLVAEDADVGAIADPESDLDEAGFDEVEPEELEEAPDTGDDHLDGNLHDHLHGDLGGHGGAENFDFPG